MEAAELIPAPAVEAEVGEMVGGGIKGHVVQRAVGIEVRRKLAGRDLFLGPGAFQISLPVGLHGWTQDRKFRVPGFFHKMIGYFPSTCHTRFTVYEAIEGGF